MKCVYGWAGVRYVITKFSRMDSLPNFVTHGAPLRMLCARESSTIILCFFVMLPASLLSSICKQKLKISHLFTFSFHFMINFYVIIFQNYGSSSVSLDKLGLSELTPGPASWNVEVFVQALKEMVCNWLFQHINCRGFRSVDRVLNWLDLALYNHVVSASILCHPCYLLRTSRDHVTAV